MKNELRFLSMGSNNPGTRLGMCMRCLITIPSLLWPNRQNKKDCCMQELMMAAFKFQKTMAAPGAKYP